MKIIKCEHRNAELVSQIYEIWYASVKATHHFLSAENLEMIAQYVPEAIENIEKLAVIQNEREQPIGFAGVEDTKLEMLFIHPEYTGKGIGRQMIEYVIREYKVTEVCVNEQNPNARGFYERVGFQVYQRDAVDEQGNSFPILHMKKVVITYDN